MSKELFAQRLKASMEKQHMKQIDLVRAAETRGIKLGKSHVSQYVSGKTLPRTDVLHFLADALHTDPDWLSGMNGPEAAAEAQTEPKAQNGQAPTPDKPADIQKNSNPGGKTMRTFKKSSKLDNVLYDVRGTCCRGSQPNGRRRDQCAEAEHRQSCSFRIPHS